VADAVAATTKKLEKRSILAAYLRDLPLEALPIAAVFLTGRPFPLSSEKTVNVGGALLREATSEVTGATPEEFEATYIPLGDGGDTVAALLASRPEPRHSLTLTQALHLFHGLAEAPTPADRAQALAEALAACRPPAAKYLVKIITGGMRIGVQESLVEEAIAEAFGRDVQAVRLANMLLGNIGRTAVLAHEDRLGQARLTLFRPLKFMLATAIDEPEEALKIGPEWLVEDKFDGIRCQVHSDGKQTRLYSRTLDEVTHQFPEIAAAFAGHATGAVLDGELIAHTGQEALGFAALSKRLGRKEPSEELVREIPVVFVAFDLLAADGQPLLQEPLSVRRERLAQLLPIDRVHLSEGQTLTSAADIAVAFEQAVARGNEGLVLKSPSSTYQPGKRGQAWLKLKRPLATLDVVVVAAEYGHGKRRGLLSDYTFAVRDGERLATVGKAYSGVTDREIAFLTEHFRQTTVKDLGRGLLVKPTIVLEVAFNGIQRSSRHQSGFALRFPRIKRLRLDKPVDEIDTRERVQELWEQQESGARSQESEDRQRA
jgi:DNA ligase-1